MPARPVGARAHRHPPRKTRRPPPRARGGKKRRWSRPRRSDRIGFRPPAALPTPSPRVRAPRRRWIGWWGFRRANRRRFAASSRFFRREFVLPGRCLDLGCGACHFLSFPSSHASSSSSSSLSPTSPSFACSRGLLRSRRRRRRRRSTGRGVARIERRRG